MNAIENAQLCKVAIGAITDGSGSLANIPGLICKIIDTEAWREREVIPGKVIRLGSFAELITKKPLEGWGQDPNRIEALLKDDLAILPKWREAMKNQGGDRKSDKRQSNHNNIMDRTATRTQGTSRAYTLSRLKRDAPELLDQVVAGEMSANAAAIEAGFRKKPSPAEHCLKAFRKAENRLEVLRLIIAELEQHELVMMEDWISDAKV